MRRTIVSFAISVALVPTTTVANDKVSYWGDWELKSSIGGELSSCHLTWENWKYEIVQAFIPKWNIDSLDIYPKLLGKRALNIYPREEPIGIEVQFGGTSSTLTYSFERVKHSGIDVLSLIGSSTEFLSLWSESEKVSLTFRGTELFEISQVGLDSALEEYWLCVSDTYSVAN